jgi:Uma2 family endonuclease
MSTIETGLTVEQRSGELRLIDPPYLLRKYEATEEEFERLADEDIRCEFMDGVLIVHSPATPEHEECVAFVCGLLTEFVLARRLGKVFGSNVIAQLGRRRACPDVSFLTTAHAARRKRGRIMGAMDLVVEVLSTSTRAYDLEVKLPAYRQALVPEIWYIDREERRCRFEVLVGRYRARVLSHGRFHSRILPGLELEVSWLWSDPHPSPGSCLPPLRAARLR